jgi:hypothetical protein
MDERRTVFVALTLSLFTAPTAWAASSATTCTHGGATTGASHRVSEAEYSPQSLFPAAGFPELQVQVLETYNYSQRQLQRLSRMTELMRQALNSEALRDYVLNHTYRGRKTFSDNEGLTNEQIYERIRQAREELFENQDHVAEFRSELYYTRRNTVGYVTPAWPSWIMTNTKFFNPWSDADVSGHLAHEWLHLIGFSHYQAFTGSVPYDVGDEVSRIATGLARSLGL